MQRGLQIYKEGDVLDLDWEMFTEEMRKNWAIIQQLRGKVDYLTSF